MANYNTFVVVDCKSKKGVLTTSSARKSARLLQTGFRIDVWNGNEKVATIYAKDRKPLRVFIEAEKEYIRQKQLRAEERNRRRKQWR